MKILLLGELSGVHQELTPGLRALGHEVVVGHSKLANASFESDIRFFRAPPGGDGPAVWLRDIASQLFNARQLTGFDIVQIITPKFFNWKIHGPMMRFLKRNNRRLVVIATSCSSDYHRRVKELEYRPCNECMKFDLKSERCIYDTPEEQRAEHLTFELADAIVTTHFDYQQALDDTRFAAKTVGIALPIDTARHRPAPMPPTDKLRIWYGETRYGFKGSAFILPALDRLQAGPLGSQIDIVRSGRLEFDDYLTFLDTLHIVIDQASTYGMGMNALYALARGRVTLTGAEPEALAFIGVPVSDNPMINIRPDATQIETSLVQLFEQKNELAALGRKSAAYVARYHASSVIAQQYEALYQRLLDHDEQRTKPSCRTALDDNRSSAAAGGSDLMGAG